MQVISANHVIEKNQVSQKNNRNIRFHSPHSSVETDLNRSPKPFSVRLKYALAGIHEELEKLIPIPDKIKTVHDYMLCLQMYFSIFQPLEATLSKQKSWAAIGIDFNKRRRTPALIADITALGGILTFEPPADDKLLQQFPEAIGALYVLEGSTLGGRFILRSLERTIGAELLGATHFFEGHGLETGTLWLALKQAVDAYGEEHADQYNTVLNGAAKIFDIFKHAATKISDD